MCVCVEMSFYIGESKIEGKGVLASRDLKQGQSVGVGIQWEFGWIIPSPVITDHLGRWINHSYKPNTELRWDWKKWAWIIVTTKSVSRNEELTLDYSDTPPYIEGPLPHYV